MTNALFDKGREGILDRTVDVTAATLKGYLIRGYTFSAAHQFISDVTGAGGTIVGTKTALTGKSYASGVLDATDLVLPTVPSGAACQAIILAIDTGTDSTSRLVAFIDTATNLPVTPNGADITVTWDNGANKIFKL